jgi:anthranilate synthase component 1
MVIEIDNFELSALTVKDKKKYPFLLESVVHNQNNRYSILFAFPQKTITLNNSKEFDFLEQLELQEKTPNQVDLPFSGGWFVYLSYEFTEQLEPSLQKYMLPDSSPMAMAVKINTAIIQDHKLNKTWLFEQNNNQKKIQELLSDIKDLPLISSSKINANITQDNPELFLKSVNKIKYYIEAGDVFQVNLSRKWSCILQAPTCMSHIYQALKHSNPAPFSALAHFKNFSIASSSPERLFSVNKGVIETRPIAGTHPRGDSLSDEKLKKCLISHPKERSEHIMLLDLERNDLGRVCEYGSIKVNEIMALETYPFVHHIVSNIKGKLKKEVGIKDLMRALFPGGTITGCPKIRCMQIISELESTPRGAYTGALGYISNNGNMDFNILIRTLTKQNNKLDFRAGAGIVFDSDPQKELEETHHKAQGILNAFTFKT